jgi:glycosyltransferase involved in cell wall biosynthesis/predicted N-acetyltransferase YhbS
VPFRAKPLEKVALVANSGWYLFNFRLAHARELRRHGIEVHFLSPRDKYVTYLEQDGFPWTEWRLERRSMSPFSALRSIWQLRGQYRNVAPSVIHHHTPKAVFFGTLAARLSGNNNIVNSVTGLGHLAEDQRLAARILFCVERFLYWLTLRKLGKETVFQNGTDRDLFLSLGLCVEEASHVISGSGVDPIRFAPMPFPSPESEAVVLFASRLLEAKGIREFEAAAKIVKSRCPRARFVVAGDPDTGNPTSISPEEISRWQREGIIERLPHQDSIEILIGRSSIVVLPSWREGLPRILLEAGAMERPVVTTNVPGCRDAIEEEKTGLLVPVRDSDSLARAILSLLEQPELCRQMGANARQRVLERFSVARISAQKLSVYRKATGTISGWKVRDGTSADAPRVRSLFQEVFGKQLPMKDWAWLFQQNPLRPPIVVVAEAENGSLIGHYALVPVPVRWNGSPRLAALSVQSMIHPTYQRQGILRDLAKLGEQRLQEAGIGLGIAFLNDNSLPAYTKHFGWIAHTEGLPIFASLAGFRKRGVESAMEGIELTPWRPDARSEQLWKRFSRNKDFCLERSAAYWNWRLFGRAVTYHAWGAERKGELLGFVVYRADLRLGIRVGYIVELLFDPDHFHVGVLLLNTARAKLREEGCLLVTVVCNYSDEIQNALRAGSFKRIPRMAMPHGIHFCVREVGASVETEVPERFFLSWIDHDVP